MKKSTGGQGKEVYKMNCTGILLVLKYCHECWGPGEIVRQIKQVQFLDFLDLKVNKL